MEPSQSSSQKFTPVTFHKDSTSTQAKQPEEELKQEASKIPLNKKKVSPLDVSTKSPAMSMVSPRLKPSQYEVQKENAKTTIGVSKPTLSLTSQATIKKSRSLSDLKRLMESGGPKETHPGGYMSDDEDLKDEDESDTESTLTDLMSPSSTRSPESSSSSSLSTPKKIARFFSHLFEHETKEGEAGKSVKVTLSKEPPQQPKITKKIAKKAWSQALGPEGLFLKKIANTEESKALALRKIIEGKTFKFTREDLKVIRENSDIFIIDNPAGAGGPKWVEVALRSPALRKIITILAVWSEYDPENFQHNITLLEHYYDTHSLNNRVVGKFEKKDFNKDGKIITVKLSGIIFENQDATSLIEYIDKFEKFSNVSVEKLSDEAIIGLAQSLISLGNELDPKRLNLGDVNQTKKMIKELETNPTPSAKDIQAILDKLNGMYTEALRITYRNVFDGDTREAINELMKDLIPPPPKKKHK